MPIINIDKKIEAISSVIYDNDDLLTLTDKNMQE